MVSLRGGGFAVPFEPPNLSPPTQHVLSDRTTRPNVGHGEDRHEGICVRLGLRSLLLAAQLLRLSLKLARLLVYVIESLDSHN